MFLPNCILELFWPCFLSAVRISFIDKVALIVLVHSSKNNLQEDRNRCRLQLKNKDNKAEWDEKNKTIMSTQVGEK